MNIAAVETWLQQHTGLDASTLGAGVVARAARDRVEELACKNVDDYLAILAASRDERQALIECVVVPETWFFRDRPALDALARHVVETWGPAHPGETFRVLSAPCSMGEEPYSIAIALALAGWPLTHLRVDAVDISRRVLAHAAEGIYRKNSFRGNDLAFRDTFFHVHASDAWRVLDEICAPVHLEHGNLLGDDFALGRAHYDAIFCRNLLIYFDRATQARAIRVLAGLLTPAGWIAVGPAEPVLLFEHGFVALKVPSGFVLHRAPAPKSAKPTARRSRPPWPVLAPRTGKLLKPAPVPSSAPKSLAVPSPIESLDTIRALADAGRLNEAAERGAALLARTAPSPELIYLLAVVADAAGDAERAEAFYRKTLYLDPRHAESLSHLALLAEKRGDTRGARQLRERARRLTTKEVA